MAANEQKTLELTLDWTGMADASREFSIVVWRTGRLPVSIAPAQSLSTVSFPLAWRQDYDISRQQESGADDCQGNEAEAAFVEWYSDFEQFPLYNPSEGFCGYRSNSLTITSGSNIDVYYLIRAKCNVSSRSLTYQVTIKQPRSFWDVVKMSSGAHLMEEIEETDGMVTRKFHIEEDVDYRIAFHIPPSIVFPGDSFFSGENLAYMKTSDWLPPQDQWTRTPELSVGSTCEDTEDLYTSQPDCSFADSTLSNRFELQQMLSDYVDSGYQYKSSNGSLR